MTENNAALAIQEAERNTAVQEYFGYRAWLKPTPSNFRLFEAGFDRAYALLSKLRAPVAGEAQPLGYVAEWVASGGVVVGRSRITDQKQATRTAQQWQEASPQYGPMRVTAVYAAPQASEAVQTKAVDDGSDSWDGARKRVPKPRHARCSCPSGDGSLRHPCAVHPASEAARNALMAFDEAMSLCGDYPDLQHHRDALLFAVQKARAALSAQPAQKQGDSDA